MKKPIVVFQNFAKSSKIMGVYTQLHNVPPDIHNEIFNFTFTFTFIFTVKCKFYVTLISKANFSMSLKTF